MTSDPAIAGFFPRVLFVNTMFKTIIGSVAPFACLFGLMAPVAEAAPQTCAFRYPDRTIEEVSCDVHTRKNANGHNVNDVTVFHRGRTMELSVILWKNADGTPDYAETFYQGSQAAMPYFRAKNGKFGVEGKDGTTFYF